MMFGFCYVPPYDSEYFNHQSFAAIQEKIIDGGCKCIIMGNMNSRFGQYVSELPARIGVPNADMYTYVNITERIRHPNDNAYVLSTICIDNKILVVNNLKTPICYYQSDLTYRKDENWISEL